MYCIRLICKKVINTDDGPVIDEYVNATHIKIKDGTFFLLNPVLNNSNDELGYILDEFSHFVINHYQIYTIEDVQKAYNKIINAYSTLSQSASYLKDYDSVISIYELCEILYSEKIDAIVLPLINQMDKIKNKDETSSNKNVGAKENKKGDMDEKNDNNS